MHVEETFHVVASREKHSHTIIFLHGRESTASEFASEFFESQASDDRTLPEIFPTVKWVFPNSGLRKSIRFDTEESQWFDMWDIKNPLERKETQIEGLRESISFILSVVREEASIVHPERIILGGSK
jgi:predicted esterase